MDLGVYLKISMNDCHGEGFVEEGNDVVEQKALIVL